MHSFGGSAVPLHNNTINIFCGIPICFWQNFCSVCIKKCNRHLALLIERITGNRCAVCTIYKTIRRQNCIFIKSRIKSSVCFQRNALNGRVKAFVQQLEITPDAYTITAADRMKAGMGFGRRNVLEAEWIKKSCQESPQGSSDSFFLYSSSSWPANSGAYFWKTRSKKREASSMAIVGINRAGHQLAAQKAAVSAVSSTTTTVEGRWRTDS